MQIKQRFFVSQPLPLVWDFFHDISAVAECLPGAKYLGAKDDGTLSGIVSAKVGPFQANFEGEAKVKYNEEAKQVDFDGKGVDRKGASRGKMTMICIVAPEKGVTSIDVTADVQLSGAIAQFGRTGLITEIANQLVREFVQNVEAELARRVGPSHTRSDEEFIRLTRSERSPTALNTTSLLFTSLKSRLGSFFKKAT